MFLHDAIPSDFRAGMVGLGMIFDDTYRPLFEQLHAEGLFRRDFGLVEVELAAVASAHRHSGRALPARVAGRLPPFHQLRGRRRRARTC